MATPALTTDTQDAARAKYLRGGYYADARRFLREALALVESKSIRAWATSPHNRPIFIQIAQSLRGSGVRDPQRFATEIVASAIGLW